MLPVNPILKDIFFCLFVLFVMKATITLILGVHTPWQWRCPSQSNCYKLINHNIYN